MSAKIVSQQTLCFAVIVAQKKLETQPAALDAFGPSGYNNPLHAFAVGKVLLAFAPRTLTDPVVLRRELDTIRVGGTNAVARDNEEYKRGLCAFAAPIWDASGTACAAPAMPLLAGGEAKTTDDYGDALVFAARAIGQALGHRAEK